MSSYHLYHSEVNKIVHTSFTALGDLIDSELSELGFNKSVVVLLNSQHNPIFHHSRGLQQHQLDGYVASMNHDIHFCYYIQQNLLGQLCYMPDFELSATVECEALMQLIDARHNIAGLFPMMEHHMLLMSFYSEQKPSPKQRKQLHQFWQFINSWANSWIAQLQMDQQWPQLACYRQRAFSSSDLTPSERNILLLLSEGLNGSEIAELRAVSQETVRSQIKQLLRKTGSRHQNQLISRFFHNQLRCR